MNNNDSQKATGWLSVSVLGAGLQATGWDLVAQNIEEVSNTAAWLLPPAQLRFYFSGQVTPDTPHLRNVGDSS